MRLSWPLAAQGDVVGFGDGVGLDRSEPVAKALASLPEQIEGVGGRTPRGRAVWVGAVLLDEVRLKSRGDFIGSLERLVDCLVPSSVIDHTANVNTRRDAPPRDYTSRMAGHHERVDTKDGSIRRRVMDDPWQDPSTFLHIHSVLARRINSGEYPAGAKLPTEAELAGEFGCGPGVAAQALRALQRDGLARKVLWKGYFSFGPTNHAS